MVKIFIERNKVKKYTQLEIDNLIIRKNNKKYIKDIDFSNCDLSALQLNNITFIDCNFNHTNLSNVYLRYANLSNINLSNVDLRYANLINANLTNTNLYNANLSYANLINSYNTKDKTLDEKLLLKQLGIIL